MISTTQMLNRVAVLNVFDRDIKVGDTVQVRWTWGGSAYIAKATVTKVNDKSIRARMEEPTTYVGYNEVSVPVGRELKFPRYLRNGFTVNNCFLGKSRWVVNDLRGVYAAQELEAYSPAEAKALALPLMFGCPVEQVDAAVLEQVSRDVIVSHISD
jgi:hypothetical protein